MLRSAIAAAPPRHLARRKRPAWLEAVGFHLALMGLGVAYIAVIILGGWGVAELVLLIPHHH